MYLVVWTLISKICFYGMLNLMYISYNTSWVRRPPCLGICHILGHDNSYIELVFWDIDSSYDYASPILISIILWGCFISSLKIWLQQLWVYSLKFKLFQSFDSSSYFKIEWICLLLQIHFKSGYISFFRSVSAFDFKLFYKILVTAWLVNCFNWIISIPLKCGLMELLWVGLDQLKFDIYFNKLRVSLASTLIIYI